MRGADCNVIAAAAIEIHFWISVPESSESSQGGGAGFAACRLRLPLTNS